MYRFKKTCPGSKKICTGSKKLEPVQIQTVPKDKLNYNIYKIQNSLLHDI